MSVLNINKTNPKDFESVISGEKPAVVEFSAPWCVYCKRLEPAFERTAEKMKDNLSFAQVNIDDLPDIAEMYGIESIPALLLFKNGQCGDAIVGPPSQAAVEEWINSNI